MFVPVTMNKICRTYANQPVDVLEHVEVWRDVLEEPGGLVGAQHLVHEVHVTEVVARPTLVLHLQ